MAADSTATWTTEDMELITGDLYCNNKRGFGPSLAIKHMTKDGARIGIIKNMDEKWLFTGLLQ
jgi:hypothetical protein